MALFSFQVVLTTEAFQQLHLSASISTLKSIRKERKSFQFFVLQCSQATLDLPQALQHASQVKGKSTKSIKK